MSPATLRPLRYGRAWLTGRSSLDEEEIELDRDGEPIAATLRRPRSRPGPLPAWVILHGITRRGRNHPELLRFVRALTATGVVTLVPDVPEWRDLAPAPHLVAPTVRAGIAGLDESGWARDGHGVIGFSFGAPHAIACSGIADLRDRIAATVGFGGYYDLGRTVRFMMTGLHEWQGQSHRLAPDPYGRWIIAANYLTLVPGYEDAGDVAVALHALAARAGDLGVSSLAPVHDAAKVEWRGKVAEARRALFDLFVPPPGTEPDMDEALAMAERLTAATRRAEPQVEPAPALRAVDRPVHIMHGRRDHLVPFSEGLRLSEALAGVARTRATVTRLFGHSAQDPLPGLFQTLSEIPRFLGGLSAILNAV